jgi:hypothetical protein
MKHEISYIIVASIITLTGCGGGSSDSDGDNPTQWSYKKPSCNDATASCQMAYTDAIKDTKLEMHFTLNDTEYTDILYINNSTPYDGSSIKAFGEGVTHDNALVLCFYIGDTYKYDYYCDWEYSDGSTQSYAFNINSENKITGDWAFSYEDENPMTEVLSYPLGSVHNSYIQYDTTHQLSLALNRDVDSRLDSLREFKDSKNKTYNNRGYNPLHNELYNEFNIIYQDRKNH